MTKADKEGPKVIGKYDEWWKIQQFEGIHPKKTLVGLTRLNWTPFEANGWLIGHFQWSSKDDSFWFRADVVNLKHQGAGQKLMIGWHKHQGVSKTLKNANVICEQPKDNRIGHENWRLNFLSITFKLGCCGSKICVADNFNHNKNITFKIAAAAATLVTDQVVWNI